VPLEILSSRSPRAAAIFVSGGLGSQKLANASTNQTCALFTRVREDVVDQPFRPFVCGNDIGLSMVPKAYPTSKSKFKFPHNCNPLYESALLQKRKRL